MSLAHAVVFAGGYALASGMQPGPLQAFLLTRVAQSGWRRTLPAALSPLVSDGPIALLVLVVLGRLPAGAGRILQAGGGLLLLYLGGLAIRQWARDTGAGSCVPVSGPRTLLDASLVNLLNPNPYLGWSLVLGPAVLDAWRAGAPTAGVVIATFYVTMVATLGLTIVLFGATGLFGPRVQRNLVLVSGIMLAGLGACRLVRL